jgi:hypothetical protein
MFLLPELRRPAANRLSQNFRLLLDQLGIDPEKEGEVYECGPDGNSTIYGGWFYLVGELVVGGERLITDPASGFQYYFLDAKGRPKPPVDFGDKVLALEFVTRLPSEIPQHSQPGRRQIVLPDSLDVIITPA